VEDERRRAKRRARKPDRNSERHNDPAVAPDGPKRETSAPRGHPAGVKAQGPGGRRERPAIEKGTRVRVLEGAFSGKVGVVQEVDGKGGARVMLGLLAVRVDVKDLVRCTEGRHRPILSSSYRKPVPVRS
jgi:hypothetical protein